ncbi:unnamed protein product [Cylindrotheca closterium]|uniref:AB hydrolase-1 domain-containing protein n=1 Tax=Cylindrotheca closterium TaxID=2856 RepID=A0AAD2FMZ8_9STRA|nr:unnamed protein product [Cylindrotheca closterium]
MDYFVERGYPVVALSLRGTGGTFAGEGVKKVKIDEHATDIQAFLGQVDSLLATKKAKGSGNLSPFLLQIMDAINPSDFSSSNAETKPVLISHSFGGAVVMKYMEKYPSELSNLSGAITLCSVPPSGNGPMTIRFLSRSLVQSWKITAGFALKRCVENAELCRDLFFGGPKQIVQELKSDGSVEAKVVNDYGVSDDDIARFQTYFQRDTEATIDVSDFVKNVPSKLWDKECRAPFVDQLPPCLVVGATRDFLVDREGVDETAKYFGVKTTMVESPHDVMIGECWQNGADTIYEWLQSNGL